MAASEAHPNLWLIRTQQNIIAGPVPKDQVLNLIREGKLGPQDEVCQTGVYWIYLHEEEEVLKQLGIHSPRGISPGDEEEVTETETRTGTVTGTGTSEVQQLDQPAGDFDPEQTAILSHRALQEVPAPDREIFQKIDPHRLSLNPPVNSPQRAPGQQSPQPAPVIRPAAFSNPPSKKPGSPALQVVGSERHSGAVRSLVWGLLLAAGAAAAYLKFFK